MCRWWILYTDGDRALVILSFSLLLLPLSFYVSRWLKPTRKEAILGFASSMPHKDCKYENGFCRNHFSVKEKSFQSLERFFFVFSWDIQNHNWFRCVSFVPFFSFSFYFLWLSLTVVIIVACDAYIVRHFPIQIEKTMDFLGVVFILILTKCMLEVFRTFSTLAASCELLMWNGKVYADGLQFKWFASFSCPQILIHIISYILMT